MLRREVLTRGRRESAGTKKQIKTVLLFHVNVKEK
jgi:hypothetical protein